MDSNIALEILEQAKNVKKLDSHKLNVIKKEIIKKYKIKDIPTNIDLLTSVSSESINTYRDILITKPVRTGSGVAVIAVMTHPFSCPHGKCIYCPGGPKSHFGNVPQSYTGNEPATLRGIRNNYDPYLQIFNRLEQYIVMGQNPEKVELIIMGGTFPSFPNDYKKKFISESFQAMNDFSKLFYNKSDSGIGLLDIIKFKKFFCLPGKVNDAHRIHNIQEKLLRMKKITVSLSSEKKINEKSKIRCVALCIETRPDFCKEKHINEMLDFGTTRVELGVQTLKENVLKVINRGHTLKDTVKATQLMKDSFLKVGYHMMPGLPKTSIIEDIGMFKQLFTDSDFMPDALKIYPTMVMPGTELFNLYKKNKFSPLTTEDAAQIIAEAKKYFPEWVRVMRVQRDIPTKFAAAGVDMNNLRQHIQKMAVQKSINCRCIHCREPKSKGLSNINLKKIKIKKQEYSASGGVEIFISANDVKNDLLLGFCRLRIPYKPFRKEISIKSAGIRELHVYSHAVGVGAIDKNSIQHRGIGRQLLNEAENLSKNKFDIKKLLVISGVGVRLYYYNLGYKPDGVYVSKKL